MAFLAKRKPRKERRLLDMMWSYNRTWKKRLTEAPMALIQKPRPALKQPAQLMRRMWTLTSKNSKTIITLPFGDFRLSSSVVAGPGNIALHKYYLDRHGTFKRVEMAYNGFSFSLLPGHLPGLCFPSEI